MKFPHPSPEQCREIVKFFIQHQTYKRVLKKRREAEKQNKEAS